MNNKLARSILGILCLTLGIYLFSMKKEQDKVEPSVIRIWVSGETQKWLFFEHQDKPLLVHLSSANNKELMVSGITYDPQYRPRWISVDSPGGLSGVYEIHIVWPGGTDEFYFSYVFPKNSFCFEYKLQGQDDMERGHNLKPISCPN